MSSWSSNGWEEGSNLKKKLRFGRKKYSDLEKNAQEKKKRNSHLARVGGVAASSTSVSWFELVVWWFLGATLVAEDEFCMAI